MKLQKVKSSIDQTLNIFIEDSTSPGDGLTGLVYDSAGFKCLYVRPRANATALNLVTQTITGAHTDGGFVEIDSINMPGVYRLDLSDSILLTGVDSVMILLHGASNMKPVEVEIQLTGIDFDVSIPIAVWDEVLTGVSHNITNSAGRRLREVAGNVVHTGTAQGPGTNSNQIQLDIAASSVDGAYDPAMVALVGGTGAGQCRGILQYDGPDRMATMDRNWKEDPDDTSEFIIYCWPGREHVNEGLAQGGTANTIKLNALASSFNNAYVGQTVFVRSGKGEDQMRLAIAYDGVTKILTIEKVWDDIPNDTSGYVMLAQHSRPTNELLAGIVGGITEGSYNLQEILRIMMAAISGVTTNNGTRFRNSDDTKDRIAVTLDENNNRTNVILDGS